jgi:hypothetical protein
LEYTREILESIGKYDEFSLEVPIHCPLVDRDLLVMIHRPGEHWDQAINEYSLKCVNSIPKSRKSDVGLIEDSLYSHFRLIHSMTSEDKEPPTKEFALGNVSRYGDRPSRGYDFKYIIVPDDSRYTEAVYAIYTDIWWDCEHGICCVFIDGEFRGLADQQDDYVRDVRLEFPIGG